MVKIESAGKSFQQGWNDATAAYDEQPEMSITFSYNYWLDTAEVTQRQFFDLLGRQPVPDSSRFGKGNQFPVYNVSWFDAVLYCNARSKADSLDTVYSYSGKNVFPGGGVFELTGLHGDLSRDGYRLPTEAEWEFAARDASSNRPFSKPADSTAADVNAWYARNAGSTTHPVASKLQNTLQLHDMAGNVFEWTNDWKSLYGRVPLTDPIGAQQPGKNSEKVIKGGSFNYDLAYIRPTCRSATYSTIPSSASEYVGFRCARGVIRHGQYSNSSSQDTISNPVQLQTDRMAIQSFFGAREAKVAFVNVVGDRRMLCVIDFSELFPVVRQFTDDNEVFMPTLSPDGRFVAYCNRGEGFSGLSTITVRSTDSVTSARMTLPQDSAFIPRWWVDPRTFETCIIFTNSSIGNTSTSWPTTKTYKQVMQGGTPNGAPIEITNQGSYHDGMSECGRFLLTAAPRLMVKDLVAGSQQNLFQPPNNGKDASASTQVCNASISPDTGADARCLFLDFGYNQPSAVTGCPYGIHQFLFVMTLRDSITRFINTPPGESSWDGPEWSNRSDFAIACTRDASNRSHAVNAVNLATTEILHIAEGVNLQSPHLWIGQIIPNPSGFSLDSIGRYGDPLYSAHQSQLGDKILSFWKVCDVLQVAIIGSSQAVHGLDPRNITDWNCYNLSNAGGDLLTQKHLILHYLLLHSPKLKAVCSSLDPGWLGKESGNFIFQQGLGQSLGFKYDSTHGFWSNGISDDFKTTMRSLPPMFPWEGNLLGFGWSDCFGWGDTMPACNYTETWTINDAAAQQNMATIVMLADSLRTRGIHWIMIEFPMSPYYKNSSYYGLWGPLRTTALAIHDRLVALEKTNPYFHFYNANMDGDHDYSNTEAQDLNHLCPAGAIKLSTRVDSLLHSYLKNP